jgi:hypothetical protein
MRMQIKVQVELPGYGILSAAAGPLWPASEGVVVGLLQLLDYLFDCEDGRLPPWVRVLVMPVQVLPQGVETEVASCHTIWVQHRHYLDHEMIQECESSGVQISVLGRGGRCIFLG